MGVEHDVIAGAAVGEVGHPVAAGVEVHVAAAVVGYLGHGQTAGGRVCQHHGIPLPAGKGEGLLEEDAAKAGGSAHGDRVEAVGDPVIV